MGCLEEKPKNEKQRKKKMAASQPPNRPISPLTLPEAATTDLHPHMQVVETIRYDIPENATVEQPTAQEIYNTTGNKTLLELELEREHNTYIKLLHARKRYEQIIEEINFLTIQNDPLHHNYDFVQRTRYNFDDTSSEGYESEEYFNMPNTADISNLPPNE
jgi:hypothetical protein